MIILSVNTNTQRRISKGRGELQPQRLGNTLFFFIKIENKIGTYLKRIDSIFIFF